MIGQLSGEGSGEGKPTLVGKVDKCPDTINAVQLLSKENGLITVSDDRTVRVWLRRDTGQYWPSICHSLNSPGTCLDFNEATSRLFVGMGNGVLVEYKLSDDFNSLKQEREYFTHSSGAVAVQFAVLREWVVSVGKDKQMVWQCSETGRRLGSLDIRAWPTCLQVDSAAGYAFVGDYSGSISVIRIQDASCSLVTKLSAHTGSLRSLAWDAERQHLYSASNDHLIIVWDIGSRKGSAYELNGHESRVAGLQYSEGKNRLLSVGDDGRLAAWDMTAQRKETAEWLSSDVCQRCDAPFFWNLRVMWDKRVVGMRQHHCRLCGKAVCATCSSHRTKFPRMGYEYPVRVCDGCHNHLEESLSGLDASSSDSDQMKSLAVFFETKQTVTHMDLDEMKGHLATVGSDRSVKIWDVSDFLR